MKRIRALTEAERLLWAQVAATVTPRRPELSESMADLLGETAATPAASAESLPQGVGEPRLRRPVPATPSLPPLAPIERRLRQRLSRGQRSVEAVIDLHGQRQAEAHSALIGFLRSAQQRGQGVVLVVTGKGGRRLTAEAGEREGGVLRRLVPLWLAEPALRSIVIGFEPAAPGHGGDGALYVRLRKLR